MTEHVSSTRHFHRHELTFSQTADESSSGVTLHDVKLLAEGTWTDSFAKVPVRYSAKNLSEFTIRGTLGYTRHSLQGERGVLDEIGELRNTRYSQEDRAIMTDLYFHGLTQASRDVISLLKDRQEHGLTSYVSPELLTVDTPTADGLEASNITITGWIVTDKPACKICAIPKQMEEPKMTDTAPATEPVAAEVKQPAPEYVTRADLEEVLNALKAELEKKFAEQREIIKSQDKTEETAKTLSAYDARIKSLEEAPRGHVASAAHTLTAAPAQHFAYEYSKRGY